MTIVYYESWHTLWQSHLSWFGKQGEDMQASCFKDVAGIEESTLVHDHVSEFKYLGLILFLFRFVVNIKVLWFWFSPARKNASFEPLLQSGCHMAHTFGRRLCRWTLWLFALKTCLRLLGSLVHFWRSGDKDTHEMPRKKHLNTSYGQRGVSLPKSKATCLDFFCIVKNQVVLRSVARVFEAGIFLEHLCDLEWWMKHLHDCYLRVKQYGLFLMFHFL